MPVVLALALALLLAPALPSLATPPHPTAPDPQTEAANLKAEAIRAATQAAQDYPEDPLGAALLGSACFNTGQSSEARKHLERCLATAPATLGAYEILARMAHERGDPEEAARLGRQALQHGNPGPELLNQLARALLDLGESAEALRHLQQAARLPRAPAETHYLLGQAQLQAGNPRDAKAGFQTALDLMPDHTQAAFGLMTACLRLGDEPAAAIHRERFRELEARDRKALADRTADSEALTGLPLVRRTVAQTLHAAAQLHQSHRQHQRATPLLLRATLLDPETPAHRIALETHFLRLQSPEEGLRAFTELAKAHPNLPAFPIHLGRLHTRLRRFDEAEQAFRTAQRLAPGWPEGYRALAELLLRTARHPSEALAMARKTVELAPTAPHYHLLGAILAEQDHQPAAIDALRKAASLDPDQPKYREFLQALESSTPTPTP